MGLLEDVHRTTAEGWQVLGVGTAGLFSEGQASVNLVAAVPSLHSAFTALVAMFLWTRVRPWARPLLVLYPLAMGLTLIATGEHYFFDVALGWLYAGAVMAAGPGGKGAPGATLRTCQARGLSGESAMKIRAAVLEEFGQPLAVQEVELAEPRAGEVLVRLVACGVCHTDLYTASGADPSGYAPAVLGHEGAGVVEKVGDGRHLARARRPRRHPLLAAVPRVRPLRRPAHQPLHGDPRRSRTSATCPTAPRGSRAAARRSATSWAARPSPSTR